MHCLQVATQTNFFLYFFSLTSKEHVDSLFRPFFTLVLRHTLLHAVRNFIEDSMLLAFERQRWQYNYASFEVLLCHDDNYANLNENCSQLKES